MAFASWLRHEEIKSVEIKRYKEEELHSPLWIRVEVTNPKDVLAIPKNFYIDQDVAPIWQEKQVEAMSDLEDTLRLLGEEATLSCHRRWQSLPHDIQIRQPHFPDDLHIAFFRTPLYKETMRNLKVKWIRLRFNPSIPPQPSPLANLDRDKEKKQWIEVERTKGYYEEGAITTYTAWDIRQRRGEQQ